MLRLTLIHLLFTGVTAQGNNYNYGYNYGGGAGGGNNYNYNYNYNYDTTPDTQATGAASATTTTTTTTTTPAQITTNANPNPSINQRCPTNPGMNDRLRVKAEDMHNYRRRILAQGTVQKNTGKYLPKAGDMIALKYDCGLETSARAVVSRCSASPTTPASNVQENILRLPRSGYKYRIDALQQAIKNWWKQVRLVEGIGMQVTYRAKHLNSTISSFTRMAWSTTRNIGCAVSESSQCRNYWYIACHYQVGGNVVGSVVYAKGEPCSLCPIRTFCRNSLCNQK